MHIGGGQFNEDVQQWNEDTEWESRIKGLMSSSDDEAEEVAKGKGHPGRKSGESKYDVQDIMDLVFEEIVNLTMVQAMALLILLADYANHCIHVKLIDSSFIILCNSFSTPSITVLV